MEVLGRSVTTIVLFVGFGPLIGILFGIDGSFLVTPALLVVGYPSTVVVGTGILQMTISGGYGAFVYTQARSVALPVVGSLPAGSALGARIGAGATPLDDEDDIKGYFAVMLLAGSLSVGARELSDSFGDNTRRIARNSSPYRSHGCKRSGLRREPVRRYCRVSNRRYCSVLDFHLLTEGLHER